MSLKYPNRYTALQDARREYEGDNKRQKWEYLCAMCNSWYKGTEVQVDHIVPCGELTEPTHVKKFVLGLFCNIDNLQVLCRDCHLTKTKGE